MKRSQTLKVRQITVLTCLTTLMVQSTGLQGHAVQMGIPSANAQNKSAGQRVNSKVIPLLLASTREENPEKAIELLKKAREEVKKEGLAEEDTNRIIALIEDLEKKALARLELRRNPTGPFPLIPATTSRLAGKIPTVTSLSEMNPKSQANEAIDQVLSENPDVRDTMWEIGRSRLARDTQNLQEIVKERTGQTVEEIDKHEAEARTDANKPSPFLELLNSANILKLDFTEANLKLKQEYSGVSLDVIADKLTNDAAKYSFAVGAAKGSIGQAGTLIKVAGVSTEVVTNFLINAKLVLRLAELYGIELDDSEKQIVLFSVYSAAKFAVQMKMPPGSVASMMGSFGQKFGQLKFGGKAQELLSWLQKFVSNKTVAKIAGPAITGTLVTPADTKAANEKSTADDAGGKKRGVLRSVATRLNVLGLLSAGAEATLAGSETLAMGATAKYFFKAARDEKRIIYNEEFRRFLMTPTGEGFFKLLVLSMNDGRPSLGLSQNARSHGELKQKSDFVLNMARSARVCSTEDLKKLADIKSHTESAAVLNYACQSNANTDRSERLKNEFLTFDAIPQDYVADLRTVSREHRLRMAGLIVQMQFLDGDRSPSETQFFRSVITKALGVDVPQDLEYFERLHAFIQENGGLMPASDTPTGVSVRANAVTRPYNMDKGYSLPNAPEPAAETPQTRAANENKKN